MVRDSQIHVRYSKEGKDKIKELALSEGLSVSRYIIKAIKHYESSKETPKETAQQKTVLIYKCSIINCKEGANAYLIKYSDGERVIEETKYFCPKHYKQAAQDQHLESIKPI